jgi:hypothetical protein
MHIIQSSRPLFDSKWRSSCCIRQCSISDVSEFIQAHYLHKRPAIVLACLVMMRGWERLGCIIYSAPPKQSAIRYGGVTWELARLYIRDDIPTNAETWLIAQSVKWIRSNHSNVEYLVSYADPSVGHKGTIYKAANWHSDGMTDDCRKTPRCDYLDMNTGRKYGRRGNMPSCASVARIPRISKLRFVLALKGRKKPWPVTSRPGCMNNNDQPESLPIPGSK